MRHYIFVFVLLAFAPSRLFAQCAGCNIDSSYTSPGIYPNPLPDGTQGQPYNQDVTFVMFTDTSGLSVNYFKITSVTGLPFGLNWECNSAANGCQYDPQASIYGCVKVCGTPLQAGSYTLNVNVDVNLQVVGTQQSTINIPITILPASGGNSGFTFGPTTGCDSLTVAFNALISGPGITSYQWNFSDGTTADVIAPQHFFSSPGDYAVTLQTTLSQFALTDVNVASVNENWCGDVEEPSLPIVGCQGSPDLYVVLTDAGGNTVYTSSIVDDVDNNTWNGLSTLLDNPPYSITVWDDDPVSVNDNLGTFSFSTGSLGTINLSGAGGTTLNVTLGLQTVATFNDADIVHVLQSPSPPIVNVFDNDTICNEGSAWLVAIGDSNLAYQWYANGSPLAGAGDSLLVNVAGNYVVTGTAPTGCAATSIPVDIVQMPSLPPVNFVINGNTLTTFLTQYSLQWFENDLPISGATQDVYQLSENGAYHLQACDDFGCCRNSDTFNLVFTGIGILSSNVESYYYNPQTKELIIKKAGVKIGLVDALGREMLSHNADVADTKVSLSHLPQGMYVIYAVGNNSLNNKRIIITR